MRIDAWHAERLRRDPAYVRAVAEVESDPLEFFASRIAARRSAARLSQVELARRARTTQAMVSRLESAVGNPKLGTIRRVLAALSGAERRPPRRRELIGLSR